MIKTPNLDLPIYNKPDTDTFKVADWNKANENIDYVFGEFKNNPNVNAIDIKAREDIINNHREVTEQLDSKASKDDVAKISSGTPLFASSTVGMTDTTKNYVNTTDGCLYVYLNNIWTKTSVQYQSTGIADRSVSVSKLDYNANFSSGKKILNSLDIAFGQNTSASCDNDGNVILSSSALASGNYDWFSFNKTYDNIHFIMSTTAVFFVLCSTDTFSICLTTDGSQIGQVNKFTHTEKKNLITLPNVPLMPKDSFVCIKKVDELKYDIEFLSNNNITKYLTTIDLNPHMSADEKNSIKYGFGALRWSGNVGSRPFTSTMTSLIESEFNEKVNKTKMDIYEKINIENEKQNQVTSNAIMLNPSYKKIIFRDIDIIDGYWGDDSNKLATIVTHTGYYSSKVLIQVPPNCKLKLMNWGKPADSALAYAGYDNDRKAYNGTRSRVNFSSGVIGSDGAYTFELDTRITQIGLSLTGGFANAIAEIIPSDLYIVGESITKEIDKRIANLPQSNNTDKVAEYFQKGNSIKTFSKKPCILVGGQSNADGRVPIADLPNDIVLPIQNVFYCSNRTPNYGSGVFQTGIQQSNLTNNLWAFDLVTFNYISKNVSDPFYVIKLAEGGTSIDINGATDYHWTADFEKLSNPSYSLLLKFESMIRACISAQGQNFDVRAMLWHQGEGDSGVADKYYDNLKYMIAYCRGIVGNKNLPFILGTISKKSSQYNQTIDDAMRKIANDDPYVRLIDLSEATLLDPYHFNGAWSEYFGKCVYNELIDTKVISASKLTITKPTSQMTYIAK